MTFCFMLLLITLVDLFELQQSMFIKYCICLHCYLIHEKVIHNVGDRIVVGVLIICYVP